MTTAADPYEFKMSEELMEEIDSHIISRVRDVVMACQDRDDDLLELHLMLEGISQPTGAQPWPNACEVEASLVREFHTTLHASTSSSSKQYPYCITEPVHEEDEDIATDYEDFINKKAQMDGYEEAIDDILYNALESRFAPMYVGYSQDLVKSFELGYRDSKGNIVDPELREPDQEYEEQLLVTEDVVSEGIDFRPVTPWNFYVDPIDSIGPQIKDQCERVIERMLLTREHLTRGVRDLGYSKKDVKEMLRMGPTGYASDSRQQELNENKGLNPQKADYWECFQVIGRLPYIADKNLDNRIPERIQYVDFIWMVCPDLGIAFKRAFSSFPVGIRPYAIFNSFKKPNSMLGHGLVSLLRDLQNEMTALERFGINKLNLEATPMLSVPERWMVKYTKWKVAPGRLMPRVTDNPNEIHPVTWDTTSQNYIMAWMDKIDAYASRIAAAQSANSSLAGKVRKATEVQFADAMMQTKFDLIQSNINRGIKDVFTIMAALCAQHAGDDPSNMGPAKKLTRAQIQKNFRFIPQANAEGANSSLRLQKDMVIGQIARQSAVFQQRTMAGDLGPDWVLTQRQLIHAGWREPSELLGPKPDPNEQNQPPHPKGKPPIESISYKDAPDPIKRQMEAQAGLQPAFGATSPSDIQAQADAQGNMQGGQGENPDEALMQHMAESHQQGADHGHEAAMQMLKHLHEQRMKQMELQHQAQQAANDRMLQAQEGQQTREAQIQQAKLRPAPAKSNGKGH